MVGSYMLEVSSVEEKCSLWGEQSAVRQKKLLAEDPLVTTMLVMDMASVA